MPVFKLLRTILAASSFATLALPTIAETIDLNTPEGANLASRKMQCSIVDKEPVFYWWNGKVFSRRMGEPDKHLFNIEGMNVRTCKTVDGGKRGKTYRLVSREILIYTDPKTGAPIDEWDNPWTGETVKVRHVENDPVNQPPRFPRDENGKPYPWTERFGGYIRGDSWWQSAPIPLYYNNPLAGGYQKEIGGVYHASELFNFAGSVSTLVDPQTHHANVHVGWVRISDWLPWMMMEGREGIVYMHAAGNMVDGFDDLGAVMQNYIETRAPIYREPPPVDDDRPNVTSWSFYGEKIPAKTFSRKRH